jgi:hypothetical protein
VARHAGVAVRDGLRGDDPAVHRPVGDQGAARRHLGAGTQRRPGDAALRRRRETGVPGRPGRAARPVPHLGVPFSQVGPDRTCQVECSPTHLLPTLTNHCVTASS